MLLKVLIIYTCCSSCSWSTANIIHFKMDTIAGDGSNSKHDDGNSLESGGNHHGRSNNNHHHYIPGTAVKITLLFLVFGITCLILNQSSIPTQLLQRSYSPVSSLGPKDNHTTGKLSAPTNCVTVMQENVTSQNLAFPGNKEDNNKLKSTLRKAAMKDNKTVIITTLNAAWTEPNSIFDLFIESFKIGNGTEKLLKHIVVAALDQKAYSRCLEVRYLHCYALTTDDVDFSGEAFFMSEDYLKMMWRRIDFLRTVLEMGYNFVFTDADVMWLRDPFERFYPDGDFQIACDHYWYNSTDLENSPNGGFNYVKSNNRTIRFYKFWHAGREYFPGKHDQDVLNMVKFNPFIQRIGLEIRFLDTAYFGGFCEPSKDLDLVITMHANCCIGLENKIHDIKMVIDDWKRYTSSTIGSELNTSSRSWTVPRICG